ncbi:energy-coupling factor ABC transporter ATP-binding protein [Caldicellulosiruptor morganii]|uniref:Energy-coupling factor ABC transporter ATP-binding protein n=1 Tax=Caldicellulosiruptor morganii TaxID=1387555 RepID=A0ABY7BK75_9FIRM|nr:ABC transporter ATP-binding protein [Caldicellulosiruptor morganii]WAM33237.1 energy-coupling factor ABC transporter ATP-binding protein [Caldicellulosiruptor morganii]
MNVYMAKNLTFKVNNKIILDNLNFEIEKGKSYALIGCNGSGKTTLMKILAGVELNFEGELYFFGRRLDKSTFGKLFEEGFYKKVGYMFQDTDLQLFNLNVFDEIAFGPRQYIADEKEIEKRVLEVSKLFGLENLLQNDILTLSGGEKKKVALASILVNNPDVLILDEPTNDLDPKSIRFIAKVLGELKNTGKTIIISTHRFDVLLLLADFTIVISSDHRILRIGKTDEILKERELLVEANVIDEEFEIFRKYL